MDTNLQNDLTVDYFLNALVATIEQHGKIDRETLLGTVFGALESAINQLEVSGQIAVERDLYGESHLDVFLIAGARI
ncbi:MAG: hypothetical protein JWM58_3139 [Rhizobium sp.]|nr:hypothetical protein [Rhizobium sp.]